MLSWTSPPDSLLPPLMVKPQQPAPPRPSHRFSSPVAMLSHSSDVKWNHVTCKRAGLFHEEKYLPSSFQPTCCLYPSIHSFLRLSVDHGVDVLLYMNHLPTAGHGLSAQINTYMRLPLHSGEFSGVASSHSFSVSHVFPLHLEFCGYE